jgi:hypothetical protein
MTEIARVTKPSSRRVLVQTLRRGRAWLASARSVASPTTPVSREFARLGRDWRVLDDVPAGRRGRLDHLVIGPGGVFVVTGRHDAHHTICLGGESLLVDGNRVHHGRLSRQDAAEVSGRLSDTVGFAVPVTALVLIVGDRRFVVPRQPDDAVVRVTTPAAGVRWMRRRGIEWTAADVERIYAGACEPETWSSRRPAPGVEPKPRQTRAPGSRAAG